MKTLSTSVFAFVLAILLITISCTKNASVNSSESATNNLNKEVTEESPGFIKLAKTAGFNEMLLPNAKEQFGAKEIAVVGLSYQVANDAKFTTLEYQTDKGITSYAMHVVVGKQTIRATGIVLQTGKEYTVDRYGTCDCRERWYPATGAIECTCSDCMMKVTQISREF